VRVLIDVSRPETIPCTIKDAIIGYVKSLPNRAIEEIESYDRNIQYKNDVICAVERYLNPTKAESLYQEIKKDLSDCDLDLFHATRVLCEDDIKINGLLTNERTRYLDYLYRAFQHTNLSEISINRAIHNVENEYDRKYTERKSVLCFFAPMSLAESSGIAGYDKYCANIGGELAEWGLKENQHEVYEALRKIGIPVIVEFRMPFEQITDYAQEKIIFQFILYYAGQLFWNKKFTMQLEGMTENDVAASEIIAVHHYNKEVDYE